MIWRRWTVRSLSGSYPALAVSGFRPVETLKGRQRIGGENWFGQTLVALQFVFSLILIVTTLVMGNQLAFMRTVDLGFNPEQVVMIDTRGKNGLNKVFIMNLKMIALIIPF